MYHETLSPEQAAEAAAWWRQAFQAIEEHAGQDWHQVQTTQETR